MMTPATAANALPRPSVATVRLSLTESQAREIGLLGRWQAAQERKRRRQERCITAAARLQVAISDLISFGQSQDPAWGLRKLAVKAAIPERTLRRIRDQKVNPFTWLPKVEAALSRLTPG